MSAIHVMRVQHDPESHAEDCCDECTVTLVCPGVTDSCRVWWECDRCRKVMDRLRRMGSDPDHYQERVQDDEWAHGVEHQFINYALMTPGTGCIAHHLETDVHEVALHYGEAFLDGDHPVDLECEEDFVNVMPWAWAGRRVKRGWLVYPPADSSLWHLRGDLVQYRHDNYRSWPPHQCLRHPLTGDWMRVTLIGATHLVRPCTGTHDDPTREVRDA